MRIWMNVSTTYFRHAPHASLRWSAIDADNWEPGCPSGHGATEAEAIAELLFETEERMINRDDWHVVRSIKEQLYF